MSPRSLVAAYVGLGANLGDPPATLRWALGRLAAEPGIEAVRASSFYRSAPVQADGPWYVNAVAELHTRLSAPHLLQRLQAIEADAGRTRPYRNAPRTLDLDLLLYGSASIVSDWLIVPHPRLWQRAFVLHPLGELAPHRVPPTALQAVAQQPIERLPAPF